jgi:signal transduction histidine kinase
VRESIVGRMERNGGRARITSSPGAGTEVELTLGQP